jgi:hypothetical protein
MRGRRLRRGLVLAALVLATVGVGVAMLWPSTPRDDRITYENFRRIRPDTSWAELVALMGSPGDYSTGPTKVAQGPRDHMRWDGDSNYHAADGRTYWISDTAVVSVYFEAGEVGSISFTTTTKVPRGPLDNLHQWLKRRWRKLWPA